MSFGGNIAEAAEPLQRMTDMMARRGPDEAGIWSDRQHVALGFRRLSILDLTPAGNQPMTTTDGSAALVFNGEVYNFGELKHELSQYGVRFRSTGDAEVVLHALRRWGSEALRRFNGMFALAFYDAHDGSLLLARDHAGIKPLYWFNSGTGIVFGSQLDQLLCHPWVSQQPISAEGLDLYLRFGQTPAPYSIIDGVRMVPAGEWIRIERNGKVATGKHFEFPVRSEITLRGNELIEQLDEAVDRSVKRHMVGDVPVGVLLSGGIDSPLVAAFAQKHAAGRLIAFSIGNRDSRFDESEDASRYAQAIQLQHEIETADADSAWRYLTEAVAASSEPTADHSIIPTLMVSRMASNRVKVVLSGDGGDELFWGYPARFAPVMEQARYFSQNRLRRLSSVAARRVAGIGSATRGVLSRNIGDWFEQKHEIMPSRVYKTLFPNLAPPIHFDAFDFDGRHPDEIAQWMRWNEYTIHLSRVLSKVDRASMHHSLEVRVPLLDKEIITVAAAADWRSCLLPRERIGKLPLRKLLQRRVGFETPGKRGFDIPLARWLRGPLQPVLFDVVISSGEICGVQVPKAGLQRLNQALLAGDDSVARGLWAMLMVNLWSQMFFGKREGYASRINRSSSW